MSTNDRIVYLDSSAIVKLVVEEPQTHALRDFLRDRPLRMSSALAQIEVTRVSRLHGSMAAQQAQSVLRLISIIGITADVVEIAGRLQLHTLRSLDAIHLATALLLGSALDVVVTYDDRMESAGKLAGMRVARPA